MVDIVFTHVLVSICAIAIVAIYAIAHGLDGNVAYMAIVAIAGLGGYEMNQAAKKQAANSIPAS